MNIRSLLMRYSSVICNKPKNVVGTLIFEKEMIFEKFLENINILLDSSRIVEFRETRYSLLINNKYYKLPKYDSKEYS